MNNGSNMNNNFQNGFNQNNSNLNPSFQTNIQSGIQSQYSNGQVVQPQSNVNNQTSNAEVNQGIYVQGGQINNSMTQSMNAPIQNAYQPPNGQGGYTTHVNHGNIKKKKLIIGGLILVALCIIAIIVFLLLGKDKNYSRTVMIYMVGSDLESKSGLGTVDLNSIDYDKMDNENVNVVLIAGGSELWNNDYIEEDETSIYELTEDGYKKVKTQSIQNMGDTKVFRNFLNYVYDNYKTDKYDLVFWNHGGAITGSEFDDLSGDNLSIDEMKNGLAASKFGENKLEVVIFRTCLNGTIEMADTIKDYAEYLVASEEVTLGASIASVLNFVNEIEPTDSGYDVSIKFVNSYKEQIGDLKQYYGNSEYIYSTYSVIDLSKVDKLVESLNEFISDINVSQNYEEIAKVRSNLYQYAYVQTSDPSYDMVDLYNLVDGLKNLSPNKADDVLSNLEDAIVYNWATNDKSRGMSIYFPYNGAEDVKKYLLSIYDDFESLDDYNDFISSFYLAQSNGIKNYSFATNKTNVSTTQEGTSDFTLELTDEQLAGYAKAQYLVFMDKGDGYYWPVYKGLEVDLNGNTLSASINGKAFKLVDDEASYLLPLYESYNDEDYIKYTVYGVAEDFSSDDISEWKVDSVEMSLILDKKTQKVSVGSVVLNEDGDLPNSVAVDLNDYQYISFGSSSRKLLDENGNVDMDLYLESSNGIYEGVELTIDELDNFKLAEFGTENDYYCVFRIYDVNNNVYYSKLIKMN